MKYPKMNGELRLLMLMYRQLEEAQALGKDKPLLEYREASSGLTACAVGMDDVEEVRYGGRYYADELIESAGEPLRRLSADGYVEFDHGDPGPSSGTITITEEGLKKIRFRRNFESNLPRSSGRWGACSESSRVPTFGGPTGRDAAYWSRTSRVCGLLMDARAGTRLGG